MENRLIHLTDETDLHISYTDFMLALNKSHECGDIVVQDKQGKNYKIHSIQNNKLNTILVIEPEYDPENTDWEE
jgi:hypothetical protein